MKKLLFIITVCIALSLTIVACSHELEVEYYPSGDTPVFDTVERLAIRATDIIRAEVIDSRTEWIFTILLHNPNEVMDDELISHYTRIHTIHRLKVVEVFRGDAEIGDILEVMQPGGRLGNSELINNRRQHFEYGDELVFFARNFREFEFGHLPMSLVSQLQGAYRIAPSSDEAEAFAEGIISAFNANPNLASFTLEGTNEWNNVVVTVGDLMQIRYEAGLGPYPGYTPTPTPTPPPTGNPTQTGKIGTTQTAAPWRLYPDGTLVISPGTITWPAAQSPWHNYRSYILRVIIEGPITSGPSIRGLFAHLPYVTEIIDLHYFDTSGVTNMNSMFNGSVSLAYLDVSSWDTSNVTSMAAMFNSIAATSLDVSNWDTSQVTTMNRMFQYATNLTTLDVSGWDTSNVTDMEALFHDTAITSLDVSNWNTSNVTSMNRLFQRTPNLTNLDVSSWNTGKVTDMTGMFDGASSLTTINVSNWDTNNVTQMRRLFSGTTNVTALDVSNWNTGSATNMEGMFINIGAANLDLSRWNTSNVTTMANMFNGAAGIVNLDISNFNTRNVTSMNRMFQNMTNLATLDISGWNTSNVTDMFQMFGRADALRQISLGEDFRFVTDSGVILLRSGTWRNMGSVGNADTTPAGTYVLTTAELMTHHNANPVLDTWVMD